MELFTPAWKSKNLQKALQATVKISDPEKLKKVAIHSIHREVYTYALSRITDQKALEDIARSAACEEARFRATKQLSDTAIRDAILKKIVIESDSLDTASDAVALVADKAIIDEILAEVTLRRAIDWDVVFLAINRLSNEKISGGVSWEEKLNSILGLPDSHARNNLLQAILGTFRDDSESQKRILSSITDQAMLAKMAESRSEDGLSVVARIIAIDKLSDQETLKRLCLADAETALRRVAAARLTDQRMLRESILENMLRKIQGRRTKKENAHSLFMENIKNNHPRAEKEREQCLDIIKELDKEDKNDWSVIQAAACNVTDRGIIIELVKEIVTTLDDHHLDPFEAKERKIDILRHVAANFPECLQERWTWIEGQVKASHKDITGSSDCAHADQSLPPFPPSPFENDGAL